MSTTPIEANDSYYALMDTLEGWKVAANSKWQKNRNAMEEMLQKTEEDLQRRFKNEKFNKKEFSKKTHHNDDSISSLV